MPLPEATNAPVLVETKVEDAQVFSRLDLGMRPLRFLPAPQALVEVTVRTLQGRYLLRPSSKLNDLFVGVLGRALELYSVNLHAVVCMSNHFHLLVSPDDCEQLARFMNHVTTNLSKEIGRLHDWPGPLFERRYHAIPVSDEEAAQVSRLKYLLSHGCKEGLVRSPAQWPGIHSANALTSDGTLDGHWYDRSKEYVARARRKSFGPLKYATKMRLRLAPLPCWASLQPRQVRKIVRHLISQIESETREGHLSEDTRPAGAAAVLRDHPHHRPKRPKKRAAPRFHAFGRRARERLRRGYSDFLAAYRAAATRLHGGDLAVDFPPGSFPPPRRFVGGEPFPVPG